MAATETYPNSLLFAGHPSSKKELFAAAFAQLIICKEDPQGVHQRKFEAHCHPDLHIYKPEGKLGLHSIDSMRRFREEVFLAPYESGRKVFLIHEADRMLPYSANALLKTFEEPPFFSVIILLSCAPEKLLPTILSRCQTVYFQSEESAIEYRKELHPILLKMLTEPFLYANHAAWIERLVAEIEDAAEQCRKAVEQAAGEKKELTAYQQEMLEKEADGAASMSQVELTENLFECFLAWHRDLHLLKHGGAQKHLFFPHLVEQLKTALNKEILPLEKALEAVAAAKKSLQRSTPLQYALEGLLLSSRE